MKAFHKLLLTALIASSATISSCHKDDNKNNNIVSKTGVALSGDQEVPVRTSSASGTMNYSYDKSTRMLSYTVNWNSLTGMPTGSHIHGTAARGMNAGIKHDFLTSLPKTTSGTYSGSVMVDGVAIKEDSLLLGFYYMNLHTPTNPGGEIRGQMEFK